MSKSNLFKWLIIVLTVHIFSVMAGLLHNLNGKNESIWLAFIFAASYSVASAFIVYIAQQRWLIIAYALADGIGVLFYYFSGTPQWIISIYFGIYTFGLIASTIYIQSKQKRKSNVKSISKDKGIGAKPARRIINKKDGSVRQSKRTRVKNSKDNTGANESAASS